jgi:hypothetical protein
MPGFNVLGFDKTIDALGRLADKVRDWNACRTIARQRAKQAELDTMQKGIKWFKQFKSMSSEDQAQFLEMMSEPTGQITDKKNTSQRE